MTSAMGFYLDPIEQQTGGSLPPTNDFEISPIERRTGGSLPPTGGGFQLDPIEQPAGPQPLTGFHTSPIEQASGGSLMGGVMSAYGPGAAPASGLASIYSMFFGD